MQPVLNIIHLPHRTDREECYLREKAEQGIKYLRRWPGIVVEDNIKAGVSRAHRQIVSYARAHGLERITIAEDDIQFTAPGAWQFYIDNFPEDYDIYLGMVYSAEMENNRILNGYSGHTLYTVHKRFYDFFLTAPDTDHLDRWLGNFAHQYKYYVCPEFVCYQSAGYSDNKGRIAEYSEMLRGKKLFGREIVP